MSVEQVDYIHNLDPELPQGGDSIAQGDDHLRNIKKALKQTFPNVQGEVLPTHEELNNLVGTTEPIKDSLDAIQNTIDEGVDARFDDNDNLLANGIINTDKDVGIGFYPALWNDGIYGGVYPVDANGDYREASLGDDATPWRAGWFAGSVHSPAYFTDSAGGGKYYLTIYSRSIWNDGGGGLYFGGVHILPGDDSAGTTDAITNLGSWNGFAGKRFRNICLSGSVLGRSAFSDDMSVGMTMSDAISMFERVKDSASRASSVEELRSSIVDTFGELISQLKDKQSRIIEEIGKEAEDY